MNTSMKKTAMSYLSIRLSLLCLTCSVSAAPPDPLEASFVHPPASARPWVYWMALDGNLTKDGITADLEAMSRVGIGGALYLEVERFTPTGPAAFAGPMWMEMNRHICNEAKRLGLEVNFNNDAGWAGSGGPWITPELSMQTVVLSETPVDDATKAPIILPQPKATKDYYRDIAVLAMPAPEVEFRLPELDIKACFIIPKGKPAKQPCLADFPAAPAGSTIPRGQVIDLTAKMDSSGKLDWTPPAGKWRVMRIGHTTTGHLNSPAPVSGQGLECDKLSKAAATFHFEQLMGKIIAQNRALTGQDKTLVGVHIDSWEVGAQNWTGQMREEFRRRRGYDLLPFLPTLSGLVIDSTDTTERFLRDFSQTISEMVVENYAGTFQELAHQNGLRLTIEAYNGPCMNLPYAGRADEPMGEFWAWPKLGLGSTCTEMASAGHTYGKRIISAEAFTSRNDEKWLGHPGNIKDLGDWAFCEGINRFVFHRYAAQPWKNVAPGMGMGPFGLHYERTQTWWEQSKAWHLYLTRCQGLLQQGQFVADIAYLTPEVSPRAFQPPVEAFVTPNIRGGYGFDGCSPDVLLTRMSVKDGRLVLPDGMSYRALVLPPTEVMTPALLARIQQLAEAGAMIVGPAQPPRKSLNLLDMGAGDEQLAKNAADLWASGKILTGKTAQEFLADRGVPPDFTASPALRFTHRRIGDADVYFVANPEPEAVNAVASFRVTGRQPEIWSPESGHMEKAASFVDRDGVTRVALHLEPNGSAFVVFRKPSAGMDGAVSLRHEGKLLWALPMPKPVFTINKATYGDPANPQKVIDVKAQVQALVDGGQTRIPVVDMKKVGNPALGAVKTLSVEYTVDGQSMTSSETDKGILTLRVPKQPSMVADVRRDAGNGLVLSVSQAGSYDLQTASGKPKKVQVPALPATQEITGPWKVDFAPDKGGPGEVMFDKLADWSKRPEAGIKYYSGTAVYQKTFVAPPVSAKTKWILNLGAVEVMAEVKLNGKDLGILWKPPYKVDVTSALKPGENQLELKVVNLWVNRQIGDEQLPEDSPRTARGTLETWPEWVQQEKPSPTGRFSFTTHRLWKKKDKLVPSGLIGPVTLQPLAIIPIQ
jgi:hypothetical protein